MHTLVLADAGGPTALTALPWLQSTYGGRIVTVTVDLGQERDLEAVRDRALAAGAACAHVIDRRAAFARDFLLPALKADADLPPDDWAELVWPLLGQALVEIAALEGAVAVAHGCAVGSRAGLHLEAAVRSLGPDLAIVAAGADPQVSRRSVDSLSRTTSGMGPEEPAYIDLAFARGVPCALNGIEMPLEELLASLNTIAGAYGSARPLDAEAGSAGPVSNMLTMAVLRAAHVALRHQVTDDRLSDLCDLMARQYGAMMSDAQWFSPARRAIDQFADGVQARLTGTVRLKLLPGGVEQIAIQSPFTRAGARRSTRTPLASGPSLAL